MPRPDRHRDRRQRRRRLRHGRSPAPPWQPRGACRAERGARGRGGGTPVCSSGSPGEGPRRGALHFRGGVGGEEVEAGCRQAEDSPFFPSICCCRCRVGDSVWHRVTGTAALALPCHVQVELLDLADLASVRAFVRRWRASGRQADLLICNAGELAGLGSSTAAATVEAAVGCLLGCWCRSAGATIQHEQQPAAVPSLHCCCRHHVPTGASGDPRWL